MNLYSKIGNLSSVQEAYQSVPRNFEIHGEILKKEGKELRLQTDEGTVMDILLKKDMDVKSGQTAVISRKDIESLKVVTKKQEQQEVKEEQEEKKKLDEVGAKDTEENRDSLKKLRQFGIDPTKENIEKLSSLYRMLENMKGYLSVDVIAELRSRGLHVDEISLADLDKVVKEVRMMKPKEVSDRIRRSAYFDKISDKEAKEIAKNLYGSEMGKDILDCIKAIKQMGLELTKASVDELHDIFSKLYNIQDVEASTLVQAIDAKEEISIDLLYKLKNYVKTSQIPETPMSTMRYVQSRQLPTEKEMMQLEPQIRQWLEEMGLGMEYESIARELLQAGQAMDASLLEMIKGLRDSILELQQLMDKKTAAAILSGGIEILGQDVQMLLKMVKEIQAQQSEIDANTLTKREEDHAKLLIHLIRQMDPKKLLSDESVWTKALDRKQRQQLEELILGQPNKETDILSRQELTLLRTASILQSVREIEATSFESGSVRLIDIARQEKWRAELIEREKVALSEGQKTQMDQSAETSVKFERITEFSGEGRISFRYSITRHYQILRSTLRATHVYSMMRDGVDPLTTDIREMNRYIRHYEEQNAKYSMQQLSSFERDKLSIQLLRSDTIWSLKEFSRNLDVARGRSGLTEGIQKLWDQAELRSFQEVKETMRTAVQILSETGRGSKREYEENMAYLYRTLKETEEIVKGSKREDKELFERYLKEVGESIRESAKVSKFDQMIQIPLFMNSENGSANVFAKSNKKGKKEIDPEDMNILIDLNTKHLGKVGFYLRVEEKEISIDLSVSETSSGLVKQQLESLSNLLSLAGYHLSQVNISTEESAAQIAFTEDTVSESRSGLDVRV